MQITHSTEIKPLINGYLLNCKEELLIISAFVKLDTLIWIDQHLLHLKRKQILVRFRKSDILFGATDFGVIEYCLKNNWEVKFDIKLHSKIYVFDKIKFILGSANLTGSGLSLYKNSNIESVVSGSLSYVEYEKIYSIFLNGISFSAEIIEAMNKEMQTIDSSIKVNSIGWTHEVILKSAKPKEIILFKEDCLTSQYPNDLTKQDMHLLGLDPNEGSFSEMSTLKSNFLNLKIYDWLKLKLVESDNTLYFGRVSQLLHENIALNERVYRKDIKFYVENLINWIIYLEISEIKIDRPNYSQRIRIDI